MNFKHKRKMIFAILLTLITAVFPANGVMRAQQEIIYQSSTVQNITSGATLESIKRFTVNGWLSIHVLRVDLSNPHVKLETLTNPEQVSKTANTKSMAESKGAVAAVNGSFFSSGSQPGYISNLGPIVQSGTLISADSSFNKTADAMATFAVNKANEALFNYWKTDISLTSPNGKTLEGIKYNKAFNGNGDIVIQDRRFSTTSVGTQPGSKYGDVIEMVVRKDVVVELRDCQPATEIPADGYVVTARKAQSNFLLENFKVGDPVTFSMTTTPDWKNLNMAVSGGAILLKDGVMPQSFSHTYGITGRHPRTAVGSSKDGKQVILVTVDGRQQSSIGMTLEELSRLMAELGAYHALNLDGGGSTTMVSRKPGTNNLEVVNNPSDGIQRRVASGIGVLSLAPPSSLDGMIIDTSDINVFVNTSRSFTVRGYDRYFNPVTIDPASVKWSVTGIQGSFKGNTFYPTSVGEGKIIAAVGNVKAELPISSLSSPVKLELSSSSISMPVGSSKTFTVRGMNRNGYYAEIHPLDVTWSVTGNVGTFSGDMFIGTRGGLGYIDAAVGSTHAYCQVAVIPTVTSILDNFETPGATFTAYPASVQGSFEISAEQKKTGKTSGKLTYNFEASEETRAAYVVFPGNGLPLPENTLKVGMWVYNDHENSNWLRLEVYDANNQKQLVEGLKVMGWTGWKYIEIPLSSIKYPARLTRVYLAQVNPVAESGSIYIDDLDITVADTASESLKATIDPVTDTVIDRFEETNGTFVSYPSKIKGSYSITDEQKKLGGFSGKLTYEFVATEKSQAAYLLYPDRGLSIPAGTSGIGLWVYNSQANPGWLRAEVYDKDGAKHYLTFTEKMDWTGWKYVEAPLKGIKLPARIQRLYIVSLAATDCSGSLYFDDLTFRTTLPAPVDPAKTPTDTLPVDENNVPVVYKQGPDAYRFAVFGQSREPKNPLEKLLTAKLADKTNKFIEAAAFVGNSKHEASALFTKPLLATNTGYKSFDIQTSRFIQLDMSKKGLRLSSPEQWHWLLNQLDTFNGKNVFIFLANSPKDFSDSLEADLFKETLTQYRQKKFKNIWVFFSGTENTAYMERGIKYFSSAGYEVPGLTPDNTDLAQYILVTIMGDSVTFQFKPIV